MPTACEASKGEPKPDADIGSIRQLARDFAQAFASNQDEYLAFIYEDPKGDLRISNQVTTFDADRVNNPPMQHFGIPAGSRVVAEIHNHPGFNNVPGRDLRTPSAEDWASADHAIASIGASKDPNALTYIAHAGDAYEYTNADKDKTTDGKGGGMVAEDCI